MCPYSRRCTTPPWPTQPKGDPYARHSRTHHCPHAPGPHARHPGRWRATPRAASTRRCGLQPGSARGRTGWPGTAAGGGPDPYGPVIRGERPRLEIRMAANRDLPKLGSACTTVVMARESDPWRSTSLDGTSPPVSYCAFTHVSDPTGLTDTFEKKTRSGWPSAVPRWSVEIRRGPAVL
jgi:hypothetical protein